MCSGHHSLLVPVSTPGLQKPASFPPLFPSMTRKPDRERDTESRRDQRRRHQERLAVLARCTRSSHLAGCPPCSTAAPPRGGPALPVSGSCAPPAGQGPPVAGGAWVPPPNPTPNQGGGNWVGEAGRSSQPMRGNWGPRTSTDPNQGGGHLGGGAGRASLPPRDEWVPPAPWQDNPAGGRWEQPPDGNGGHGGRGWSTGGRRVLFSPLWLGVAGWSVVSSRRPVGPAVPTGPRVRRPGTGLAGQGRISAPQRVGAAGL